MGTLKAGLWILGICLAFVFFFQNFDELRHPVVIGLNLYFWRGSVTPIPLWTLLILFFLLGFVVSTAYSFYDRMMLKREVKELRSSAGPSSFSQVAESD